MVQIFLVQVTVKKWPQDNYFSQKVLLVGTPNDKKEAVVTTPLSDNKSLTKDVDKGTE